MRSLNGESQWQGDGGGGGDRGQSVLINNTNTLFNVYMSRSYHDDNLNS